MLEILHYQFMQNAFIAALFASIACGIIGSYVVVKRLVFISGGIAHAALGGIGLGYFLGINPVITLIPFSILSALGIGLISKKTKLSEDSTIGILWAMGMAVGIIFIGLTPGYVPDLFSYLFGNILTVTNTDILLMVILDIIIMLFAAVLYKGFLAISFDEEFSVISGVKVNLLYFILLSLVALTVVILIKVVGLILVISLLTIPPSIAKQYTNSLKKMMLLSTLIGILLTFSGLLLSYFFDLASGATIILVSGAAFIVSSIVSKVWT